MIINRIPFNPETAQNGDVLVHRDLGKVVYIDMCAPYLSWSPKFK